MIDNSSKAELINKSFVRLHGISTFKLTKKIKIKLRNEKFMQWLERACLVDLRIRDHHEQLLCYVAKLDVYLGVLRDGWLQTHNPVIDWRDQTMKFNSASCMEESCLLRGIPCVEFAIRSKAKYLIETEKLTAIDSKDIEIKPVSAKHFF